MRVPNGFNCTWRVMGLELPTGDSFEHVSVEHEKVAFHISLWLIEKVKVSHLKEGVLS